MFRRVVRERLLIPSAAAAVAAAIFFWIPQRHASAPAAPSAVGQSSPAAAAVPIVPEPPSPSSSAVRPWELPFDVRSPVRHERNAVAPPHLDGGGAAASAPDVRTQLGTSDTPGTDLSANTSDDISGAAPVEAFTSSMPVVQPASSVADPEGDTEAPHLVALRFDPPSAEAGQRVGVFVTASDDLSGIRTISGTLGSPSGNASIPFGAGQGTAEGVHETSIRLPENAEEGFWRVRQLMLEDNARNRRHLRWPGATGPALSVRNSNGDAEAPELIDLWIEHPSIDPGKANRISIRAHDEGAGIAAISGIYANRARTAEIRFSASADSVEGRWTGPVMVPATADCGEWRLVSVVLRDSASNQRRYSAGESVLDRGTFFVSFRDACDDEPPVLLSFALDPGHADNSGETTVRLIASIEDRSGVASAYGRLSGPRTPNGREPSVAFSLKQEGGVWTGTLTIPRHAATGRWAVSYLQVEDNARNRKIYRSTDAPLNAAGIDVR
jgi:hypothetical protein